jgi:hypothetical protein
VPIGSLNARLPVQKGRQGYDRQGRAIVVRGRGSRWSDLNHRPGCGMGSKAFNWLGSLIIKSHCRYATGLLVKGRH